MVNNTKNVLKKNKSKPQKNPQNQHAQALKQKRAHHSTKPNDWHSSSLWDGHIVMLAERLYFCSAVDNQHERGATESHWLNPAVGLVQV